MSNQMIMFLPVQQPPLAGACIVVEYPPVFNHPTPQVLKTLRVFRQYEPFQHLVEIVTVPRMKS